MTTPTLESVTGAQVATEAMRAAVVRRFGEPRQIEELPKPVADDGEIVVRIEASGLCPPTSTPRTETGPSSRSSRSRPGTKAWASSRSWERT